MKNELKKDILESFRGYLMLGLITLLFNFISIRLLGSEVFGRFNYGFNIIAFIMTFAGVGLKSGIMYFFPKNEGKYISFAFLFNFLASIIIAIITYIFADDIFLKRMVPLIWILSAQQLFLGIYSSRSKIKIYFNIQAILGQFITIGITVLLYYIGLRDTNNLIYASFIAGFICLILHLIVNKDLFSRITISKTLIIFSLPTLFSEVMFQIMSRIDAVMIGHMTDKTQVGIYIVAAQIATSTSVVLLIFNTAFAPKISHMYHNGQLKELKVLYCKATRILGLFSLITFILILIFGHLVLTLYGAEYEVGYKVVVYRAIGQFINAGVGSVWLMLRMTGKTKYQVYGTMAGAVFNIILNYLLIPVYGISGAAIASMVVTIFMNLLGFILVIKIFKINPYIKNKKQIN
ncbi:MATE family efflux transporter [Psychrilyobacter atlanticus]|uniref:MATE family efflux transporter n=1 Tax=Psychrilyobacter atlanticus TaxID=271091 RepID=UPI00040BBD9D|nr:MATE family efflux transporter [Psychrilyobacter atlanticus]